MVSKNAGGILSYGVTKSSHAHADSYVWRINIGQACAAGTSRHIVSVVVSPAAIDTAA